MSLQWLLIGCADLDPHDGFSHVLYVRLPSEDTELPEMCCSANGSKHPDQSQQHTFGKFSVHVASIGHQFCHVIYMCTNQHCIRDYLYEEHNCENVKKV
jgi:hypothetical protein